MAAWLVGVVEGRVLICVRGSHLICSRGGTRGSHLICNRGRSLKLFNCIDVLIKLLNCIDVLWTLLLLQEIDATVVAGDAWLRIVPFCSYGSN